ncbi:DUF427 domain-containing protein [Mycolicibacter kumamotonensis]|jgi:uncharacterized protein (DUF427 family)|uniref:DUF427 domain-containing protein n=1 Tax=Mycolicibacter kumamotonensis TaxID=354243 RepID=A0A1B8SC72_9MYCO|nr:DUF427 domain-containing protein [Mycolicibacter kumamotonensis]NDJ91500.1 DUF427 domain-containing protein [Mycolicibacter kumamotonensis]OBY30307.1 hypothetical protein ACT18_18480 [Mycolicibacter kumamotonensis]ORA79694.1 hypothetical protein BST28_11225 [Mycolicibacter kumamotonensis]
MSDLPVLEPTAEHPITIEPTAGRVEVRVQGQTIADTRAALTLREAAYPAVYYIPRGDVSEAALTRTDTTSYCPFKGHASYFSVTTAGGDTVADAIWTYEQPFPAVAAIAGHVAFYPDKADISVSGD